MPRAWPPRPRRRSPPCAAASRALEQLRAKLDRRFEGGRAAWGLALGKVVAAEAPAGAAAGTSAAGGAAVKASLASAAIAVCGLLVWRWHGSAPESRSSEPLRELSSSTTAATAEIASEANLLEPGVPAGSTRIALHGEETSEASSAPSEPDTGSQAMSSNLPVEIRGRFVFTGGVPAASVPFALELGGAVVRDRLASRPDVPEDWQDLRGESRADGSFSVFFKPPADFSVGFRTDLPGFVQASWGWDDFRPAEVKDLGEVLLLSVATVEGLLVDASGAPIRGEKWRVSVESVGLAAPSGREETRIGSDVDLATGRFRIEGVMPGTNVLSASSDLAGWVTGPRLTVGEGETVTADIAYAGPDTSRRIVVDVSMRGYYTVPGPAAEDVRLLGSGGEAFTARPIEHSAGSFSFDDLEPGTYAVEIDDPRCFLWTQDDVEPGSRVRAKLEGNSALLLSVIDRETQVAVDLYSVTVKLRNVNTFPDVFRVHAGKTPLPGGRLGGMFPCDCTVAVRAGDLIGEAEVDGLQAGETRPVRIEVRPASSVSGRVTYDDGAPAAGMAVALVRPAEEGDSDASPILGMADLAFPESKFRREFATTTCDELGRFRLEAPRDGSYLVRASAEDGTEAFSGLFTLAGEQRTGLELVLSRPGSIWGTIHAPAGASPEGLTVWVRPDLPGTRGGELFYRTAAALGADGRYSISSVRSGPATVYLVLPPFIRHGGGWTSTSQWSIEHPYGGVELGTVEIPAGGALEQDFTPVDFPGTLELHVRVNGRPAPRLALRIRGQDAAGGTLEVETDDQGVFGPWPIFAGIWSLSATDPETGWQQEHPDPIAVAAASPTIAELDLERP